MVPQLAAGSLLLGLGCDVIEVDRVRRAVERQGERFLARVFTEDERAYCRSKAHPFPHYAARFAAKEAVSKCFTTGIGAELSWKSVSIRNGTRGEPLVTLDDQGLQLLHSIGGSEVRVSLSHTEGVAMAVAAIVRLPA